MRLLFITQKIDRHDGPLGFVHGWVEAFAARYEKVTVICLERGEYTFSPSVEVLSLGKESRRSRLQYVLRFWSYIFTSRREYDVVLVHMNQEYVLLGAFPWKLMGKRVGFWYNHGHGNWLTRIALALVDLIFHTSPYAFTAGRKKSRRMPAGIPTDHFVEQKDLRDPRMVLFLGRIAPIKGVHVLLDAFTLLEKNLALRLSIYGDALPHHRDYEKLLREKVSRSDLRERINFYPTIPNTKTPEVYSQAEVFVNLSPSGLYDKTVLEAMACGTLPVLSSTAFNDVILPEYRFQEGNAESLAQTLTQVCSLSGEQREKQRVRNRSYVVEQHSLPRLVEDLKRYMMTS